MNLTPSDIIAGVASVANVGLLTGIFFKLGALTSNIADMLRRLDKLEGN